MTMKPTLKPISTSSEAFENKKALFIATLKSEKGNYRISDSKSLNLFHTHIDVILSILALNFECVCAGNSIHEQEKRFTFETENKNRMISINSKTVRCTDLDVSLIRELVNIILSVATSLKKFFVPYVKPLSKISMNLNNACSAFPRLAKSFIALFKFYLDDTNFIDEQFCQRIMENVYLCEYHFFFITLLKKAAFVKILNGYKLVDYFFGMYNKGNTRILRVMTNILEIYQQKDSVFSKSSFDVKRIVGDLANREEYLLECFLQTKDTMEVNYLFELISALLSIKTTHFLFVNAFCTLIDQEKILHFNEDSKINDIHTLYAVKMLSDTLSHEISGLYIHLENKLVIHKLVALFFKEENLTYFHQTVFTIIQNILSKNSEKYFRIINVVLSVLEVELLRWGREFFARENEKEWSTSSLNAYCLELYKELVQFRNKCLKEFRVARSEKSRELVGRMDNFMKSDEYLFVKWYYERNIRSEGLNLENEKDVELFFEDCISEAHIRYLYYMVIEHIPENPLFE